MRSQDLVQEFHSLRSALLSEREQLQERLQQIDAALSGGSVERVRTPSSFRATNGTRGKMPLRDAVLNALSAGAKTKDELMAAVRETGYKFTGANPMNSLQSFLYGAGKKLIKRVDGKKFALASGAARSTVGSVGKAKRRMSAEGRKRIAAAARARWARVKAGKSAAAKPATAKRTMSAAGRARISAAAKARWAKVKAAKA